MIVLNKMVSCFYSDFFFKRGNIIASIGSSGIPSSHGFTFVAIGTVNWDPEPGRLGAAIMLGPRNRHQVPFCYRQLRKLQQRDAIGGTQRSAFNPKSCDLKIWIVKPSFVLVVCIETRYYRTLGTPLVPRSHAVASSHFYADHESNTHYLISEAG